MTTIAETTKADELQAMTLTGLARRVAQLVASFDPDCGNRDPDLLELVTVFLELRRRVQLVFALNSGALREGRISVTRFRRANRILAGFAERAGLELDPRTL